MAADRHLREYGFWDYTTPCAGGMERYDADDYRWLLDDMAAAGMNSLMVVVKWLTTGYRSRLPYLDQEPDNPMIASDNELLRGAMAEAGKRGIRVWVGAVVSFNVVARYGGTPFKTFAEFPDVRFASPVGSYDADHPGFAERAVAICREIVELFPQAAGLLLEMENAAREMPHRIPLYNAWAAAHGEPEFARIAHPLDPRGQDLGCWRRYTTDRRIEVMNAIEAGVRASKFQGKLCTICESAGGDYVVCHELDLVRWHAGCPNWAGLFYEGYDKSLHRLAMMDLCIQQPKALGIETCYLPRGVMTWPFLNRPGCQPIDLPKSWAMDVEDIARFQPDGAWWFGSGSKNDGAHVGLKRLREAGFNDGRQARQALLHAARRLSAVPQ